MRSTLLKRALIANSAFSATTGAVLIIGSKSVAGWLGIPTRLTLMIGIGLLPFAAFVAITARRSRQSQVRQVILADVGWVLAAVLILIAFPGAMSSAGLWALGVVTLMVADLALAQTLGLRQLSGTPG